MGRTKKTLAVVALMGVLITLGSFGNETYGQETDLQRQGSFSGVYIALAGKATGDISSHATHTTGADAIEPSHNETSDSDEADLNSSTISSSETTLPRLESSFYALDSVEETILQPYLYRAFNNLDAPHSDIDSGFGVNILTFDTQGNITGISKKIVEILF